MVSIIIILLDKNDFEKKDIQKLIVHQIGMLINKASPDRNFLKLRLVVKVEQDKGSYY